MPKRDLAEYRAKRKATATPEPVAGVKAKQGEGRRFVVQRHSATRLHYDFRLERDGVLASWAVPKGLPTRTGARRLAVHVEDHPLEYGTFEGVIPKGQYGGGVVDIYDAGTYEIESEHDDGRLTFRLHGQRLEGRWSLVPAHLDGEERNWLLICREGAADAADEKYAPMLATLRSSPPAGAGWLHEVKLDGFRVLARLDDGDVSMWSRNGLDVADRFRRVALDLGRGLRTFSCVVDGEVCAVDEQGVPRFQLLQSGKGTLVYYLFDVLEVERRRLVDAPLDERRAALERLVDERGPTIRLSRAFDDGEALLEQTGAGGLEGIISKRRASRYAVGRRSTDWQKVKHHASDVFAIAGYLPGQGRRSRLGSLVLAARDDAGLTFVGLVGAGLGEDVIDELLAKIEQRRVDGPSITVARRDRRLRPDRVVWCKPTLRCRVEFAEWTNDGRLRSPVFKGLVGSGGPPRRLTALPPARAGAGHRVRSPNV
jgi:bifunctional non-homologous end joining protein LigD